MLEDHVLLLHWLLNTDHWNSDSNISTIGISGDMGLSGKLLDIEVLDTINGFSDHVSLKDKGLM